MSKHLKDRQLLAYLEGDLSPGRRGRIEAQLRDCSACRARLERFAQITTDLTTMLDAVGAQVPLAAARSWKVVARRWGKRHSRRTPLLVRSLLRYAVVLTTLALIGGGLVGLIRTWAVTGPASIQPTPTAIPAPTVGPSLVPGPLPLSRPDRLAAPVSLLILGVDGESITSDKTDALMLLSHHTL